MALLWQKNGKYIRSSTAVNTFKSHFKTYLFDEASRFEQNSICCVYFFLLYSMLAHSVVFGVAKCFIHKFGFVVYYIIDSMIIF